MKGDFKITLAYLKEIGACRDGQRAFQKAFPDGAGYQEVLDRCAEEDRADFGLWLLDKLGPTEDVRVYEENVNTPDKPIIFAGRMEFRLGVVAKRLIAGRGIEAGLGIKAGWGIEAGCGIEAGWGIEAGDGIKAGLGIEAGDGIEAGLGIQAGDDFGIYAGLRIRVSQKELYAIVSAKVKPNNLFCGVWKELKGTSE